jgi:predicted O-methyltransferase YrrM
LAQGFQLKHEPSKLRSGEFAVSISKLDQDYLPFSSWRRPESLWDVEIVEDYPESEPFDQSLLEHADLYSGIVRASQILAVDELLWLPVSLNLKEHALIRQMTMTIPNLALRIQSIKDSERFFASISKIHQASEPGYHSMSWALKTQIEEFKCHPVLEEIYESGFVIDSRGNKFRNEAGVTATCGHYLAHLIRKEQLNKTLEIGLAYGISALYICQAHAENASKGMHIAIDPFQSSKWNNIGVFNIERAKLSKHFKFFELESEFVLSQLGYSEKEYGFSSLDLVFVDGCHRFDAVLMDVMLSIKLLKKNGFLVLDDCDLASVKKVVQFIRNNLHFLHAYQYGSFDRTVTFRKSMECDPRPWYFHADF